MRFTIKGKHQSLSREFIRSWCHGSAVVLGYHNNQDWGDSLNVSIVPATHPALLSDTGEEQYWGRCSPPRNGVFIIDSEDADNTATVILHELIHALCGNFEEGSNERVCSTLTARLKPTVAVVALVLLENTYKNAAYLAHAKIAYKSKNGQPDGYNPDQWTRVGTIDKYGVKAINKELGSHHE